MLIPLHRHLSMLMFILLLSYVSFAQGIPEPQDPKKQPLDKPTQTQETPKIQDPALLGQKPVARMLLK